MLDQEFSLAAGRDVVVTFTPHLMPMNRGILATCYARPAQDVSTESLLGALDATYKGEPFVVVRKESPSTKATMASNAAHMTAFRGVRTRVDTIVAIELAVC